MKQQKRLPSKKMTRNEKKEERRIRTARMEARFMKHKAHLAMHWMNITDVGHDCVYLSNGWKKMMVQGIKVTPHNIFIDDENEQRHMVSLLESCFNRAPDNLYFGFVQNPVNMGNYANDLNEQERAEDDGTCRQMIIDEREKAMQFCNIFREMEFYIMIRDTKGERLTKRMNDLIGAFQSSGFDVRILVRQDYYNYIAYLFETPPVNDFVFNRGVFTYIDESRTYGEETARLHRTARTEQIDADIPNLMPDRNMILRSKMAPCGLTIRHDHLKIGDNYVANLLVQQFPKNFGLGILSSLVNRKNVKLFMRSDRFMSDLAGMLRKEYLEQLREYQLTTDPAGKAMLESSLVSQQNYINEITVRHDTTHDVIIIFSVFADSLEHLNTDVKEFRQELSNSGFSILRPDYIQDQLFRIAVPLWVEPGLHLILQENFGFLIPSFGMAGMWPFIFETLKDPKGFLLGHERQDGGMIRFDPFYYLEENGSSRDVRRANGNMVIVGSSGAGKSVALDLFIRDFIRNKVKIIWIDPESMNGPMTEHYHGTYIEWGVRGNIINLFDLKPISGEEDDAESYQRMWDTEAAIFNVIDDVNIVLSYLFPRMDERIFSLTGDLVFSAYAKAGIKKEGGAFPPFKGMAYEQMPTFATFIECLHERIEEIKDMPGMARELELLNDLDINMNRIRNEWSIYFEGHTTIDIPADGRQMISFGTKKIFNAPENLQAALNYIMFTYAWTLCLDDKERSAFIIDEAHQLILKGNTASLVSQFYRRSRKYSNAMLVATQEPRDFADPRVLTDGKAIFNNADYKLVMALKKDACDDITKLERINPTEADLIMDQDIGDAFFICGERRIPIHIWATETELREMKAANARQ